MPDLHPRRRFKASSVALLLLLLVALGAACGGGDDGDDDAGGGDGSGGTVASDLTTEEEAGEPQSGGTLTVGLNGETSNWNPYEGQWAGSAYVVANAVFDPLTAINPDGEVQPYLAEAITPNDDFTEWTIELRPDVTFHNGEPFDAEALKANLDAGASSGLTAVVFQTVEATEVVDPLTVRVVMNMPWATFPQTLSVQPGYMAAPEMLASEDGGARHPIGTGPFVFENWVVDATLDVSRNDDYWREDGPYLDGIEFQVLTDAGTRTQALTSGTVDAIQTISPEQLLDFQELGEAGDYQTYTSAGDESDETIVALNTAEPPFDDPIAREAIAVGIDQDVLAETSFRGAMPGARGPFTSDSPFYIPPEELGYPAYDVDRAKELVAEYEAEHGEELSFSALLPTDPTYLTIGEAMQAQAAEAGITVELEPMEQTQLISRVLTGDYQAAGFVLFSAPTFDRAFPFIATPSAPYPAISLNFTRNDNEAITEAMNQARATDDIEEQTEAYRTVQEELARDLDRIFLVHTITGMAYANDVHGFRATTFPSGDVEATPGYGSASPFTYSVWKE